MSIVVEDVGGSVVTLTNTVDVTDLAVTDAVDNFGAVEGQNTGTIVLATFEDPNTLATTSSVTASLPAGGWGDGTPAASATLAVQQIGLDPSTGEPIFEVLGNHTYAEEGTFTVNINVTTSGGVTTALTPGTATVLDAPLLGSAGTEITGVEGSSTGTVLLGTFVDANQLAPTTTPYDYTATVNWGDGSTPETLTDANFTPIGTPNGIVWEITAAYTYTEEGTYAYTVTVTDDGGAETVVSGSAIIADAALTPGSPITQDVSTGVPIPSSTVLGEFTDANPTAPISDFTAVIDWGNGSPNSIGTITQPGGVGTPFDVTYVGPANGPNEYPTFGSYGISIVVEDVGGSRVTLTGTADVTDAAMTGDYNTLPAVGNPNLVEGQSTGTVLLAVITDPNTLATAADLTATVDWGDSESGPATVVQDGSTSGGTVFDIYGSHVYQEEGTYDFTLDVTSVGGATTSFSTDNGVATVVDAPLTGSAGTEITGIEGSSTGTVLLGTFVDANQAATVADYTSGGGSVVVNWGDGSAPQTLAASNLTAIGTPNGVEWTINAAHTYTEEGTYSYTVTVTDDGGAATIVSGSAIIADAPLTAGPAVLLTPNTGVALPSSTVVGTFTDANTFATTADFTGTIDWGDGSPMSTAVFVATATPGVFDVEGGHIYAKPGDYTTKITVHDDGGSQVVILGSATVTDLPVTGATKNFTATEGQNTGPVRAGDVHRPQHAGDRRRRERDPGDRRLGRRDTDRGGRHARRSGDRGHSPVRRIHFGRADLRGSGQPYLHRGNPGGHARPPQCHHHHLGRRDHHADQPSGWRSHRARRSAFQLQWHGDHAASKGPRPRRPR